MLWGISSRRFIIYKDLTKGIIVANRDGIFYNVQSLLQAPVSLQRLYIYLTYRREFLLAMRLSLLGNIHKCETEEFSEKVSLSRCFNISKDSPFQ